MIIHSLQEPPLPELAQALEAFEEQFSYPLGPGRTFRISHGRDYPRFFRAIGDAVVFVAERDGQVLGTLAGVLRTMLLPDGQEARVGYLADFKVAPAARGSTAILRLARAVQAANTSHAGAYTVVMDGTPLPPSAYSGRLGIPSFSEVGRIVIFRIPADETAAADDISSGAAAARECFGRLAAGRYSTPAGDPAQRSRLAPVPLLLADGSACGLLEDTEQAKRLFTGGGELRSAHLSDFAYRSPAHAAALLRTASQVAGQRGYPALFAAVSAPEADAVNACLNIPDVVQAPAAIHANGLNPGKLWNVNTAEI
jgi:hypothetical protein